MHVYCYQLVGAFPIFKRSGMVDQEKSDFLRSR